MKLNKWTMGLAAVGLVSMPAIGSAEEQMNQVWTALSSTTLSGYVNTSMHWNPGTGNSVVPGYAFNQPDKQDGFNLNVVSSPMMNFSQMSLGMVSSLASCTSGCSTTPATRPTGCRT